MLNLHTNPEPKVLYYKRPNGRYAVAESMDVYNTMRHLAKEEARERPKLGDVATVKRFFETQLTGLAHETFIVAFLDNQLRLIATQEGHGDTTEMSVYPRQIAQAALKHNATKALIGHNHPSGVTTWSDADIGITRRLKKVLDLVGVTLHDHILVAGTEQISMVGDSGISF